MTTVFEAEISEVSQMYVTNKAIYFVRLHMPLERHNMTTVLEGVVLEILLLKHLSLTRD